MVVDRFGNFYGATVHGGDDDDGSIYKFTPWVRRGPQEFPNHAAASNVLESIGTRRL